MGLVRLRRIAGQPSPWGRSISGAICGRIDWRAGNLVQYIAVVILFGIGAWLFENGVVHWTGEFILALIWLAVVLSLGSIGLLYWADRRSAATSVRACSISFRA